MEIEIRAKIENLQSLQEKLNSLPNLTVKKTAERQVDAYIKHSQDKEQVLVFRIRRKKGVALLTLKTKSSHKNDVAWKDIDLPLEDPDRLEDILMNSGYEYVVLIDKIRDSFQYSEYEINIDNIRDLGHFIEIESQTERQEDVVKKIDEMKTRLLQLGIEEKNIIEKGYVQLMAEREKNAV